MGETPSKVIWKQKYNTPLISEVHSAKYQQVICKDIYLKGYYTPGIRSMSKGCIVFVRSVSPFVCPSVVRPDVIPSVNPFYNQILLRSFLITNNSAATDKKLFIFDMWVPERVLFHSTSVYPWVMPQAGARDQNLGHPNKVVYCSLFIQKKKNSY